MARDELIQLMIARHGAAAQAKAKRHRAAQLRRRHSENLAAQLGIPNEDAVIGAGEISSLLGITARSLHRWRAENRLEIGDIVKQAAPRTPIVASRSRVIAVRVALQLEQAARIDRPARKRTVRATGARAMLIDALQGAAGPLTAAELARRCAGGIDVKRAIQPELSRLLRHGAIQRELGERVSGRGPSSVYRYSVKDPEILASIAERGRRSRAAADRNRDPHAYAPANAQVGPKRPTHGCRQAAPSPKPAPAMANQTMKEVA